MNSNDISHELKAITDNFEAENYGVVVQQALVLIEKKLREVIKRDLTQLESSAQLAVTKYLAAKNKAIDDLTMGEIVGLLRETKFFEAWKQKFHRDLRVFETIDLNKLTHPLRNDVAHGKQSGHTREEAELIWVYLEFTLQTFFPDESSREIASESYESLRDIITGNISSNFIIITVIVIFVLLVFCVNPSKPLKSCGINVDPHREHGFNCSIVTTIPQAECETLVNLYYSTRGHSWKNNAKWLEPNDPCIWRGVGCENGRVTSIFLPNNCLVGTIPDLSQLKEFKGLWLEDNRLTGSIPVLSQLKELSDLFLGSNQLTGAIPDFSQLKELRRIHLGDNQLTGIIPDFSQLEKLTGLNISLNTLCRDANIRYPEKWQAEVNTYPLCTTKYK
jgi:hypothetical protein